MSGRKMFRAAVVIDAWKLSVFDRRLKASGYVFNNLGPIMDGTDTITLVVITPNLTALAEVVKQAAAECAQTGRAE